MSPTSLQSRRKVFETRLSELTGYWDPDPQATSRHWKLVSARYERDVLAALNGSPPTTERALCGGSLLHVILFGMRQPRGVMIHCRNILMIILRLAYKHPTLQPLVQHRVEEVYRVIPMRTVEHGKRFLGEWFIGAPAVLLLSLLTEPILCAEGQHGPEILEKTQRKFRESADLLQPKLGKLTDQLLLLRDDPAQQLVNALQQFLVAHPFQEQPSSPLNDHNHQTARRLLARLAKDSCKIPESVYVESLPKLMMKDIFIRSRNAHIYKISLPKTNRLVCAKSIATYAKSAKLELAREVIPWLQFKHDNVLPVFGIGRHTAGPQENIQLSILTPFMVNGNLSAYTLRKADEPLETDRKLLVRGIAAGMRHIHALKVVHGDLKAKNVLLDKDYKPLIADFGLNVFIESTKINSSQAAGGDRGTYPWYSPERLCDNQNTYGQNRTAAADIYAWALVAMEVYTGALPPWCEWPLAQVADHVVASAQNGGQGGRIQPAGELLEPQNSEVWKTIQRCWRDEPHERPSMAMVAQFLR